MVQAESVEGIFFPSPLTNPKTQQMIARAKAEAGCPEHGESHITWSLQHQLFLQARTQHPDRFLPPTL